ncbi:MAG TPA: cation acetate symporter [Dermatophilaceae bacterium]|nr:cation acetate symporter [Dermatophilaceae bacterium]
MPGQPTVWTIVAIALVCLLTVVGGALGLRWSRTTSDFYVASRAVTPGWNASAIGGEYLSAASFLGVAGLIYTRGLDMLWFPIGYTLGYLVLLVMVAAPLRRSGAYTLPDFAESRLESRRVRSLCSVMVVLVGWLYLLPQLHGAGLALRTLTGAPTWWGGVIVTVVVTLSVVGGGMRSITVVQAAQYWLKLFAISVPAVLLLWWWVRSGQPLPAVDSAAAGSLDFGAAPSPAGPGTLVGATGSENSVAAFAADPASRGYTTYSLLVGLCLGTMGLPHVVVRFYTNPDGRAARRTTVVVIGLLGMFYLFPPLYGLLGRVFMPTLPPGTSADTIVLLLPGTVLPGGLGVAMTAVVAAGAFAAFLSTASGLTVTLAGVINQDIVRPALMVATGGDADSIHGFRISAIVAMIVPFVLVLGIGDLSLATTVGMAFSVTASTFCPLLVLGVWWRDLSVPGITAGMLTGAVSTGVAVIVTVLGLAPQGWGRTLLAQPAAWSVPLAFCVTVVVSLATPGRIPVGTLRTMIRLHTPESAGLRLTRG